MIEECVFCLYIYIFFIFWSFFFVVVAVGHCCCCCCCFGGLLLILLHLSLPLVFSTGCWSRCRWWTGYHQGMVGLMARDWMDVASNMMTSLLSAGCSWSASVQVLSRRAQASPRWVNKVLNDLHVSSWYCVWVCFVSHPYSVFFCFCLAFMKQGLQKARSHLIRRPTWMLFLIMAFIVFSTQILATFVVGTCPLETVWCDILLEVETIAFMPQRKLSPPQNSRLWFAPEVARLEMSSISIHIHYKASNIPQC